MNATRPQRLRADFLTVEFECLTVEGGNVHHVLNLGVNLEICQVRVSRVPGGYLPPQFIKPGVLLLVFFFLSLIDKMLS